MNIVDNSGKGLAALGRNEDRFMAHVAQGEMVVPPVISDNTKALIRKEMQAVGLNPQEYEVGQGMSINPITGQAEFGFLKKLAKSVKKVVKKVAPIAAVIPGPWQPFAAVYQKGNAALKLAKGEGGLGDIMTLMAGGNQKLTGEGGAFSKIGQGAAKNFGADSGFFGSLGDIGKVTDAAGKSSYDLLGYGKNVAKGMASDQQQGYFGAFGGGTGEFDVATGTFKNYTDAAGNPIFNDKFNFMAPDRTVVKSGDTLSQIAQKNGTTVEAIMKANPGITDPNVISAGQTLNMPGGNIFQKTGNVIRSTTGIGDGKPGALGLGGEGSFFGMETPGVIKKAGDLLGLGGASGLEDAYGNSGSGGGGSGINPQMAALALLYGKAVKDFTKKTEGGLTDIRQSIRPDLNPAPVFAGFDLGVRKAAAFGGPIGYGRQNFNKGGLAAIGELDMRNGGESAGPGTGTSDDIPAMLSDGEFVMTAAANNGAGGFKLNKTKKGIELIASSKPNRKKGVDVMNKLMDTFEKYNASGSIA
jgi:nucleoid-associated protein YgaU